MFPSPTAAPMAARIKADREDQPSLVLVDVATMNVLSLRR